LEQTEPVSILKDFRCWKDSLQKLTQFSQENNVLDVPAPNNNGFFERYMCFFDSPEGAGLDENEPFSSLETIVCRKNALQTSTQFSQGNNVLDAASCNLVPFCRRDRCDSSNQLKRPIWSK
jgi:hypothetical protein